ncbi:MAG: Uma2 family endonuclease [Polyangiales bacterium]
MVAVVRAAQPHPEERLLINGVTWSTYVVLRDSLDDQRSGVRLTYLEGAMEIMSPSDDHEASKTIIGRLVEAFAEESDLDLDGYGSTTFRKESVERGLEPDECYTLGPKKEVPDVAIEIVLSAPKLDKLAVYRGLGVPEVWIYRDGSLTVHVLGPKGYRAQKKSALLPDLDLDLLASFVRFDERQTKLVKAFRAEVRKRVRRSKR